MNFGAIQSALVGSVDYGGFSDTTATAQWINKAYGIVWAAADWPFKVAGPTDIAITGGTRTAGAVTGMEKPYYVFTSDDTRLMWTDPLTFFDRYGSLAASSSGTPVEYTIVDSTLYLGPTPSASATFKVVYERQVAVKDNGGAFKDGVWDGSTSTDQPAWDDAYHYMLVHGALATGLGLIGSNDADWHNNEFTRMIEQMSQHYMPAQRHENAQFRRDGLT